MKTYTNQQIKYEHNIFHNSSTSRNHVENFILLLGKTYLKAVTDFRLRRYSKDYHNNVKVIFF